MPTKRNNKESLLSIFLREETPMPKTIKLSVTLPASSERLFKMYLASRVHAACTGGKVTISSRPNSAFKAFDSMLTGRMLHVVPKRLIVQS